MTHEQIHIFTGPHLAIWRSIKKTYYGITWDNDQRKWKSWEPTGVQNLSRHRSLRHGSHNRTTLDLSNGTALIITANGEFLYNGALTIPIVKIEVGTISQPWKNREFGGTLMDRWADTNVLLWSQQPQVQPQQPQVQPQQPQVPKRIAMLVAEDASRKNEMCPITMEPISPATAGVTSCYHVFDAGAITTWLASNAQCPQCRAPCAATLCE
jgi:hypothetical protein